ncbi:MAG: hypothetical protein KBA30_07785 [Clostridia bacterium]|nr:hypothetical protein [Clostridia bacterium]
MMYFLMILLAGLAGSVLLTWLLLLFARRSLCNRVRRAWIYPLPAVFALLTVMFSVFFTAPALLDAERLAIGGIQPRIVTVEQVSERWNSVVVDGRRLSFAPWAERPVAGGAYRMTIAPRSRIILSIEPVQG